jgi:hypothetical protein
MLSRNSPARQAHLNPVIRVLPVTSVTATCDQVSQRTIVSTAVVRNWKTNVKFVANYPAEREEKMLDRPLRGGLKNAALD